MTEKCGHARQQPCRSSPPATGCRCILNGRMPPKGSGAKSKAASKVAGKAAAKAAAKGGKKNAAAAEAIAERDEEAA